MSSDLAYSTAADPSGNVLVAGASASASIDLGGGSLASSGGNDMVVAKYSAFGAHLWSKRLGGLSTDIARAVAADAAGNVLIAGLSASSSIDLGGGPLPGAGGDDIVVAMYSPAGDHLWSKRLGGTSADIAYGATVDASGNVLIAGSSASPSIDLGGGPLGSAGGDDIVVAKYAASGEHLWSKRVGGGSIDRAHSVAADAAGNVIVASSSFSSSIDLGGGPLIGAGVMDFVLAKYSSSGQHLWSRRAGGTGDDQPRSVATDAAGHVLVAGLTNSPSIDLGGGPLASAGAYDIGLAKYSASGEHVWSKRLGGASDDFGYSVATDASGDVLLGGSSYGSSIDVGGGPLAGAGSNDVLLAKFSASGVHGWSKRLGGATNDYAFSIAADGSGHVLVAGISDSSSIDLGGGPLPSAGGIDMIVAKFVDDTTPPISTIDAFPLVVSNTLGFGLTGAVTDDLVGVDSVVVTYTDVLSSTEVVVEASVTCAEIHRRSCTFIADGPGSVGIWTAVVRAGDRAGNVESPGASATVVAIL